MNQTPLTAEVIQTHLDRLCKPPGSLGRLEDVAKRLCEITQTLSPRTRPRHTTVFAADHGVTSEGISAWPSEVTAAVVEVMGVNQTASGVFARSLDCSYEVVDVGLLRPVGGDKVLDAALKRSTRNLKAEAAMTEAEFDHAWSVGADRARVASVAGNQLLVGGEMGIGNTTSASCLVNLLCKAPATHVVGRGAGIDDSGFLRKRELVQDVCNRVRGLGELTPKQLAFHVGGFEIIALAGFYVEAALHAKIILVDGFISTAAAVLAESIVPGTSRFMFAGHRSVEPGHAIALGFLGIDPLLDLDMRLGEGTGALAALPLVDLAAAMVCDMATLSDLELP